MDRLVLYAVSSVVSLSIGSNSRSYGAWGEKTMYTMRRPEEKLEVVRVCMLEGGPGLCECEGRNGGPRPCRRVPRLDQDRRVHGWQICKSNGLILSCSQPRSLAVEAPWERRRSTRFPNSGNTAPQQTSAIP